jgi:multiple sugar transport system substrate-binding protein
MKKTISLLLATAFMGTLVFSGCSKDTSGATSTSGDSDKKVKLTITWWGSQTRHDYTQKLLEMYTQKNPNITFESSPAGWNGYYDKLASLAAGNNLPDIIQTDYTSIATYTRNNTLADLSSFVNDKTINLDDVDANLVNSGKVDGKLTSMVLGSGVLAVTYNPDLFSQAGLPAPTPKWTWDEFEKNMITIREKTGKYGVGKLEALSNYPYWVRQYGKTMFSSDGTKLGYDDDAIFVEFVKMLQRLQNAKAMPNPDEWSQISAKGKEAEPVVTGSGATTFDWANYPVIVSKSNPNLKLVTPPNNSTATKALWSSPSMFFSIANGSKNQKEAAKFINWFINDIEANKVIMAERGVPSSSKVREALKPQLSAQQKDMFDYIDIAMKSATAIDPPDPSGAAEVTKLMADIINQVLYNKTTPEKAAADFRTKANEVLKRNTAK